jgi:hypothetical protein
VRTTAAGRPALAGKRQGKQLLMEIRKCLNRGTPTVPVTTGRDGGTNPTFLATAK